MWCLLCCGTNHPASPVFCPCRSQSRTPATNNTGEISVEETREGERMHKLFVGYDWQNNGILNSKMLCPGSMKAVDFYSDIELILNHWILNTRCDNNSANSGGRRRTASFSAWLLTRHQFWDLIYFDIKVSPENKSNKPNYKKSTIYIPVNKYGIVHFHKNREVLCKSNV